MDTMKHLYDHVRKISSILVIPQRAIVKGLFIRLYKTALVKSHRIDITPNSRH